MQRILIILLSLCACAFAAANVKEPIRLDTSTQENMQKSFVDMLLSLDDDDQGTFSSAMATIGLVLSQNPSLGEGKNVDELLNGKTADEIIALSRRLTPHIKQSVYIINGSSAEEFGKTVGQILVGLDPEKQTLFSEALAKIMYDSQKKGEKETAIMKQLDGKNADEVIKLAQKIDLPFTISNKAKPEDYSISTLSDEERKKLNLDTKAEAEEKKYEESLVPGKKLK